MNSTRTARIGFALVGLAVIALGIFGIVTANPTLSYISIIALMSVGLAFDRLNKRDTTTPTA